MCARNEDNLWSLNRIIPEFIVSRKAGGCGQRTIEYYTAELRWFAEYMASQGVQDVLNITPAHMRGFFLAMAERRSPGGVHICHRVSKTFLRWVAAEYEPDGWKNPIDKIKPPQLGHEPLPPIDLEDLRRMLDTCDKSLTGTRDRAIMLTLLDTGLRAFELLALDLVDIDGDAVTVRHGKGGKSRVVFIGASTRQELNRYLRQRGTQAGRLWRAARGGALSKSGLVTIMRRRAEAAGVRMPGLHSFRRAFAVAMLRSGADLLSISRLLGHSQLAVTQRYLRLELEDLQAAHRKHGPVDGIFQKRGRG